MATPQAPNRSTAFWRSLLPELGLETFSPGGRTIGTSATAQTKIRDRKQFILRFLHTARTQLVKGEIGGLVQQLEDLSNRYEEVRHNSAAIKSVYRLASRMPEMLTEHTFEILAVLPKKTWGINALNRASVEEAFCDLAVTVARDRPTARSEARVAACRLLPEGHPQKQVVFDGLLQEASANRNIAANIFITTGLQAIPEAERLSFLRSALQVYPRQADDTLRHFGYFYSGSKPDQLQMRAKGWETLFELALADPSIGNAVDWYILPSASDMQAILLNIKINQATVPTSHRC